MARDEFVFSCFESCLNGFAGCGVGESRFRIDIAMSVRGSNYVDAICSWVHLLFEDEFQMTRRSSTGKSANWGKVGVGCRAFKKVFLISTALSILARSSETRSTLSSHDSRMPQKYYLSLISGHLLSHSSDERLLLRPNMKSAKYVS